MKVIFIVGPTASGKSSLAVDAALKFNGEVISCDSMQIYKEMNIGTAKITKEEMRGVTHHLVDFVDPVSEFSVYDYKDAALRCIENLVAQDKQPIFCGGTGLYVDALIKNIQFDESSSDSNYVEYINEVLKNDGIDPLYEQMLKLDPCLQNSIHKNNHKRVIRALEVMRCTGIPFSQYKAQSIATKPSFDYEIFVLNWERGTLYKRINKRVDDMFDCGLIDEVETLYKKNYFTNGTSKQAIGYKELIKYFEGEKSLEKAIEDIKTGTRRYAKRQITWFKQYENAIWLDMPETNNGDNLNIISQYVE